MYKINPINNKKQNKNYELELPAEENQNIVSQRFGDAEKQYLGISNVIANAMYNLVDLLEAQLTTHSNSWQAVGEVTTSKVIY